MKRNTFVFLFFIVSFCVNRLFGQNLPQLGKNSVKDIIAAMTLEEKLNWLWVMVLICPAPAVQLLVRLKIRCLVRQEPLLLFHGSAFRQLLWLMALQV
jgi:hypothetical protein